MHAEVPDREGETRGDGRTWRPRLLLLAHGVSFSRTLVASAVMMIVLIVDALVLSVGITALTRLTRTGAPRRRAATAAIGLGCALLLVVAGYTTSALWG